MFDNRYPSIEDLKAKAQRRMPRFAFEYLTSGANNQTNLRKNEDDFQHIELMPRYIKSGFSPDLTTTLFNQTYSAPIGISPIGLQGLMWPNSAQILAKAAKQGNVPFILSTVSTASIEEVSALTDRDFWFQLYHPADQSILDDILDRLKNSGCKALVLLADTPSFGHRYKDMKNGLSMPPKINWQNMVTMLSSPSWCINSLRQGIPAFATLKKYMPRHLSVSQLGAFMDQTFEGRLSPNRIQYIREKWAGPLIIKGIVNPDDLVIVKEYNCDGIIVSNHGGRQIDAGESSIRSLKRLQPMAEGLTVLMDGGIRSGPDIARALAVGANLVFAGRPFMYGVGALGNRGGEHTIQLFKNQVRQVLEQLGCESISDLPQHLIQNRNERY